VLGQRRLRLPEKGLGDVALFGERYNPWRHAADGAEVRGFAQDAGLMVPSDPS
jgi:hypothetical protein